MPARIVLCVSEMGNGGDGEGAAWSGGHPMHTPIYVGTCHGRQWHSCIPNGHRVMATWAVARYRIRIGTEPIVRRRWPIPCVGFIFPSARPPGVTMNLL